MAGLLDSRRHFLHLRPNSRLLGTRRSRTCGAVARNLDDRYPPRTCLTPSHEVDNVNSTHTLRCRPNHRVLQACLSSFAPPASCTLRSTRPKTTMRMMIKSVSTRTAAMKRLLNFIIYSQMRCVTAETAGSARTSKWGARFD